TIVLVAGAQTPDTEPIVTRAALQKVAVVPADGGVSVEMTAKGAVTPKVETLSSPARIVVDLPNTAVTTATKRIQLGKNGVTGGRIGTDASATTRVVVDLNSMCKYELVPSSGEKITLKLYAANSTAHAASVPAKIIAPVAAVGTASASEHKQEATKSASNFVV